MINTHFTHGCLSRYRIHHRTHTLAEHVQLSVTQPSCCTFDGPIGTTLLIASARKQLAAHGELYGVLLQVANSTRWATTYRFRFD